MKSLLFKSLLLIFLFVSCTPKEEITTYYLIRHAEKDRSDANNRNPSLTIKGEQRAQNWAEYFKNIPIDAVYSTKYYRTIETATPTAKTKNLDVLFYDPRNLYDSIFQNKTKGKSVLIVGHSNTTPVFANKILGENKYEFMADNDNSSLFIVTLKGSEKTSSIEKVD